MKPSQLIKQARKVNGMTQAGLAKKIGVTPQSVGNWERGFSNPHPRYIKRLAAALGLDPFDLVDVGQSREQG